MTQQPFPNLQAPVVDTHGHISTVWRAFFTTLWNRTGSSEGTAFALLNGSGSEVFSVADAVGPSNAVSLGQADELFQPTGNYAAVGGSATQVFAVAPSVATTNEAVPRVQADALYAPVAGLASQVFAVSTALLATQATPLAQVSGLITAAQAAQGAAIVAVTPTASPFAYTAPARGGVAVSGGMVSAVSLTRLGVTVSVGVIAGLFDLTNGDVLTVTYTTVPTMNFIPA